MLYKNTSKKHFENVSKHIEYTTFVIYLFNLRSRRRNFYIL